MVEPLVRHFSLCCGLLTLLLYTVHILGCGEPQEGTKCNSKNSHGISLIPRINRAFAFHSLSLDSDASSAFSLNMDSLRGNPELGDSMFGINGVI